MAQTQRLYWCAFCVGHFTASRFVPASCPKGHSGAHGMIVTVGE